jgi:hypothetical protein
MPVDDAKADAPPLEWTDMAHKASLEALRSATRLRRAKAALLISISGAFAFFVVVPFFLNRPRTWFGMEFGPALFADGRFSMIEKRLMAMEDKFAGKPSDRDSVLEGFQKRLELADRRIDPIERRCLIDGRPISIARDSSPVPASVASRVALLQVEPTAFNDYSKMTSFAARWIYPDDLEKPYVILRGTPIDTTELRLQLTWIGGDGATIGRATSVFTKTAGRWDKLVQGAQCAEVDPSSEALGGLRIQISGH